jgi:hypothetical protein
MVHQRPALTSRLPPWDCPGFHFALLGNLAELFVTPFRSLQATALSQRDGSGGCDKIVYYSQCGFEKFDGAFPAPLGQFDGADEGVRFVNQIAKCMYVTFAVGRWHESGVLAIYGTSNRLLKNIHADLGPTRRQINR